MEHSTITMDEAHQIEELMRQIWDTCTVLPEVIFIHPRTYRRIRRQFRCARIRKYRVLQKRGARAKCWRPR